MLKRWRGLLLAAACALPAVSFAQAQNQAPAPAAAPVPVEQPRQATPAQQQRTLSAINRAQASRTPQTSAIPPVEKPLPIADAYGCARRLPPAGDPLPVRHSYEPTLQESVLNSQ